MPPALQSAELKGTRLFCCVLPTTPQWILLTAPLPQSPCRKNEAEDVKLSVPGEFWGLSSSIRLSVPRVSLESAAAHPPSFVFMLFLGS